MDLYKTLKQHQQRVMRERGVIHEMIQFLTESLLYLGDMRRRDWMMLQQTQSESRLIGGLRCQECTTADQGDLRELQTDTKLKSYKQRQIDCHPNNVEQIMTKILYTQHSQAWLVSRAPLVIPGGDGAIDHLPNLEESHQTHQPPVQTNSKYLNIMLRNAFQIITTSSFHSNSATLLTIPLSMNYLNHRMLPVNLSIDIIYLSSLQIQSHHTRVAAVPPQFCPIQFSGYVKM